MTPIFQNNPYLLKPIQNFGCRFRCLQAIAEFEEQKCLSVGQIIDSYLKFIQELEIMNRNCLCGPEEHQIIQTTFDILGNTTKKGRQVGIFNDSVPMGWDGERCTFDYIICHWTTTTSNAHYTLASKDGEEIFDPWDHDIYTSVKKIDIQRKLLYRIWR